MRGWIGAAAASAALGLAAAWVLTEPETVTLTELNGYLPDLDNGETLFWIGGCASCHAAEGAKDEAKLVLEGGHRLETPFGTFVAPNISPDPEHGLGNWQQSDFVTAMRAGTSPEGQHYYPAFPYASYARMQERDLLDLFAYLQTLPPSTRHNEPHELGFPFSIRRSVGFWKLLYLDSSHVIQDASSKVLDRGRYLVEGPGHCGECHTPRDPLGGSNLNQWLAGAPNPAGKGIIPNLTPGDAEFAGWSTSDISEYLKSGFTPEYDSVGGAMTAVVENTGHLEDEDRDAIAAYLKSLPARPNGYSQN